MDASRAEAWRGRQATSPRAMPLYTTMEVLRLSPRLRNGTEVRSHQEAARDWYSGCQFSSKCRSRTTRDDSMWRRVQDRFRN